MNLYLALQAVLEKIKENNEQVVYGSTVDDKLRKILDNQERLGEANLLLGGLLQALIEKEVTVQLMPSKGEQLQ